MLLLENEVRDLLATLQVDIPKTKDDVRTIMQARKRENLLAQRRELKQQEGRALSLFRRVDYENIKPRLAHVAPKDKPLWEYARSIVSSTPYGGRVGRVMQLFCMDQNTGGLLGIVEICSDMMVLGPRDRHIGWTRSHRSGDKLRHVGNVGTCVCVAPFGVLCGGKFHIVAATASIVSDAWERRYGDRMAGLCTTSLYGESSIYNRLKEWSYLGNTVGQGMFHLSAAGYELLKRFLRANNLTARVGATNIDPSSRMDVLNRACSLLGIDREAISSHQPRGVYWADLVPGAREYLRGDIDTIPANTKQQETVADWWLDRWYKMRLPKKRAELVFDWHTYKVDAQIDLCGDSVKGTTGNQSVSMGAIPTSPLLEG